MQPAAQLAAPEQPHDEHVARRRLSRAMIALLTGYVILVLTLMIARGAYMSPDLFIVLPW